MIPLLAPAAVREIDRDAIERVGLPGLVLMENAGGNAFRVMATRYPAHLRRVVLFGGPGQNGGDAWVVARHLANAGHAPRPILVGERDKVRGDAATNLAALETLGVPVRDLADVDLALELSHATLIVDGLFGTGLDRPVTGVFADVVTALNGATAERVALDIPSGIDGATGAVLGVAVRADLTVTFAAHKLGLHQHPGAGHAGHVELASIGVPGAATDATDAFLLEASDVAAMLPARAVDAHKGASGRVWVFAGAPGKGGAAILAGLGSLRAGAGLVTLAPRNGALDALGARPPELMTEVLPPDAPTAAALAAGAAGRFGAAIVGPGLGLDDEGRALALSLARKLAVPAVIDADALSALAAEAEADQSLASAPAERVLTPHPGEAGRLLGISNHDVQGDRYAAAREMAARTSAVVVLKGARTIIAAPSGALRVCPFGTPALATGGTGDVLAGVIAAFLAGGLGALEAAAAGVGLHAMAGEIAAAGADRGVLASEVAEALPRALTRLRD